MPEPTQRPAPRSTAGRPTLEAIARSAAVSLSTVSKVLNGRPGVSTATRSRVERLLHDSGYARRGHDSERGGLLELVVADLTSEWSIEIIRGVERVTREAGLVLGLSALDDHRRPGADWITGVLNRKPVAVVLQFSDLTATHRRQLRTRNIPFVVVDPAGDPPGDVPAIGATNWAGRDTSRHWWRPESVSTRRSQPPETSPGPQANGRAAACSRGTTGRRGSSAATTCRRSV